MADQLPPNAVVYERQSVFQFLCSKTFLQWLAALALGVAWVYGDFFSPGSGKHSHRDAGGGVLLCVISAVTFVSYCVGICRNRPKLILTDDALIFLQPFFEQKVGWRSLGEFRPASLGGLESPVIYQSADDKLRTEDKITISAMRQPIEDIMDELNRRALRAQFEPDTWLAKSNDARASQEEARKERIRQKQARKDKDLNSPIYIVIGLFGVGLLVLQIFKVWPSH